MVDELGIADRALRDVADEYPLWSEKVLASEVWKQCCFPLVPLPCDDLYYSHAKELGSRVVRGEDLSLPTDAEVAALMGSISINAGVPIINDAAVVYYDAFVKAFAHRPDIIEQIENVKDNYVLQGSWSGAVAEVRQEMVRKLLQNKRGDF